MRPTGKWVIVKTRRPNDSRPWKLGWAGFPQAIGQDVIRVVAARSTFALIVQVMLEQDGVAE